MSAFERHAVQRLLDQAAALRVDVPASFESLSHADGTYPARLWAAEHPDEDRPPCCWGSIAGPERCGCWEPVYDVEQAQPRPPCDAAELGAAEHMCGDCAFRPGSPERDVEWSEDALFDLARSGTPFWCHQGMRRPARWKHPDGRTVEGSPDDWAPPMVDKVPFRADGSPGLLCAGWAAIGRRSAALPGSRPRA